MKKLLMVLFVLVLAVTVVACGTPAETAGGEDTDAPETNAPETNAPETEAPATETEVHTHDVEVEEQVATCLARGYRTEKCKTCGEVLSETAYPKTDCTPVAAATCTADSVCSVCGTVIETAKGHVASDTVVQDLGCSAVYACAGEGCTETISVAKENAEHTLAEITAYDKTLTILNGKVCAPCSACGVSVPVPEDVRLALDFDKESIAAEFEALNNDKLSFYTKEDASKGPSAQTKEVDGRSVMYFKVANPLFIDYDISFLQDAEVFVISFDYCVAKTPYAASTQVSLFTFVPGFENGTTIPGKSTPWAHTIKFDRTSLYFTDGKGENPTQYFQPEIGKWYTVTIVVDNTYTTKANGTTGKGYVFVDGEFIRTTIEFVGCTEAVVTKYGGLSWRIGEQGNTHDPLYDNFRVSVIK